MKRILFVATVVQKHINIFHLPFLKMFKEANYEVHVAAGNDFNNPHDCIIPWCDKYYNLPFQRSPFHANNITAYRELKHIVNANHYELIHCHTPVGGVVTRLAARKSRKNGTKVYYTAHGFHFYKGAPIKNWLLYYPVEKICSYFTDVLITINKEDYALAKKKFKAKRIEYVPGVGIDTAKFENACVDKNEYREMLGIPRDCILLTSVGELNKNKNHEVVIKALPSLQSNVHYCIAGKGHLADHLVNLSEQLGVSDRFHLLGYKRDIPELYKASDICVFPSVREGLPVAVMEGMASSKVIICSKIRGNVDLIDSNSPLLCDPHSPKDFASAIELVLTDKEMLKQTGEHNKSIAKSYDTKHICKQMKEIYGLDID